MDALAAAEPITVRAQPPGPGDLSLSKGKSALCAALTLARRARNVPLRRFLARVGWGGQARERAGAVATLGYAKAICDELVVAAAHPVERLLDAVATAA